MATWDATYETLPSGTTETGSLGDDRIRSWKSEIGDRFDQEHWWMSTGSTGQSVHRKGAARAYYQATAPTLRPDAATTLGTLDKGRLFVDSDTNEGYTWTGSAFTILGGNAIADQGGSSPIKIKVFPLGDWNLLTTSQLSIVHGITYDSIRKIRCFILNNDASVLRDLRGGIGLSTALETLVANNGSNFTTDSDYWGSVTNRGYLVIWYAEA